MATVKSKEVTTTISPLLSQSIDDNIDDDNDNDDNDNDDNVYDDDVDN